VPAPPALQHVPAAALRQALAGQLPAEGLPGRAQCCCVEAHGLPACANVSVCVVCMCGEYVCVCLCAAHRRVDLGQQESRAIAICT